jgi:tetratricopeptide (TPR) repeat protein
MSEATQRLHAARLSLAQGDAAAARARCLEILESVPDEAGALHLLGVIAHQRSEVAAAKDYLRRAAEAPGALPLYILSYADLCLKSEAPAEALALTRRAVALDARSALAWYSLGAQLLEAREYAESRASFERALELAPDLWRARMQLAILVSRTGSLEEALQYCRRLLTEQPGNAEVTAHYAAVLQDLGRHGEALEAIERAIREAPAELEHPLRAADIELGLGRSQAALARIEAIEPRWPDDPKLLAFKATLLRLTDRIDEAVALCRDATARGVESSDLWRAYGQALHLAGRDDLAFAALDRAVAHRPALALAEKGVMLGQLGRFPEALEAFDRALAHEPALIDAWYDKANVKAYACGDPDIAAMRQLLERGCSYRERMLLNFALGKALLEAGDADRALDHWHEGNRLKRALLDYDAAAARRELEAIAAAPLAPRDAPVPGEARRSELPVFVVGMPRCGSSLIEQILASHPQIHGGGEQLRLRELFAPLALDPAGLADEVLERTGAAALAILRGRSSAALRVVDKDLVNFKYLGVIHRVLPGARIVHCRRDPIDTCFSAYGKLFLGDFPFTYDLRELGLYYRSYRSLMDHWREALPPQAFLEVSYEELVAEPRATTRSLLEFLGLPWDEACLKFFETRRAVNTASLAQVRRPIYRSSVGRAAALRARLSPLLEALNEPAPGSPA